MILADKNIKVLIDRRNQYLKEYENSYDDNLADYTIDEPVEIDELRDEILHLIFKHEGDLEVDNILECLTHLGYSPNILYDDNGNFAVTSDCFSSVSYEEEPVDMDMSFHVPKEYWKPTIRKALHAYLEEFDPELWNKIKREKKINRIIRK
jgi:hypothetical protein